MARLRSDPSGRYTIRVLQGSERPDAICEYYVTGRGQFPVDMLRYDACWPATTDDAVKMSRALEIGAKAVSIQMHSHRAPTVGRWASFVWSVGKEPL